MRGRGRTAVVVNAGRAAPTAGDAAGGLARFDALERGEWWWRQPRWSKRAWTLEAGGRAVAELARESIFSRTSRIRFDGLDLEVHPSFTGNAELRAPGGDAPLARFRSRWTGDGWIEAPAGDRLELAGKGLWRRTHELRTEDQLVLARFERHHRFARLEMRVEFEDAARRRSDLRELIALSSALLFAPKRHSH